MIRRTVQRARWNGAGRAHWVIATLALITLLGSSLSIAEARALQFNASAASTGFVGPSGVGQEFMYPHQVQASYGTGSQLASDDLVQPQGRDRCPAGWLCIFRDKNWKGRMLKWSDPNQPVNLSDFNDEMSSWVNNTRFDARWFYNVNQKGTSRCMNANTASSYVGNADNDEASSLYIYTDDRACN